MKWFRRKELRDVWSDEAKMTQHYRHIWDNSPVLRRFYTELWDWALEEVHDAPVVELGGGAGLIRTLHPHVVTTDLLPFPWSSLRCDASQLPFADNSVAALLCIGFFHHCVNPHHFFQEIQRVLKPQGRLIIIDPWIAPLSRWVYRLGTDEDLDLNEPPFETSRQTSNAPLLSANVARATNIFGRHADEFQQHFPNLQLVQLQRVNLFRHLIAGSCVQKSPFPTWTYPLASFLDSTLGPLRSLTSMCAKIVLEKRP